MADAEEQEEMVVDPHSGKLVPRSKIKKAWSPVLDKGRKVGWRYQHFVEGVASEQIARDQDVDRTRIARVFSKGDPQSGKTQVHIVGSQKAVDEVAEGVSRPNREVHKWYIGPPESSEEETEAVGSAAREFLETAPPRVRERVSEALGLPPGEDTLKQLSEATEGFEIKDKKSEESKGGG